MNLQDVFDQLTYGELSNYSLGGAESGGISEANKPKVISQINMAVSALYVKFNLSEHLKTLTLIDGITDYTIDHLTLLGAYNDEGKPLGINDPNNPNSIFVADWSDTIQIPATVQSTHVYVSYLANPPKIDLDADSTETEIELPDILLEALLAYVASRVCTSKLTTEGIQDGIVLMHKFDLLCQNLKNANILNYTEQPTNINLEMKGWL